ncbi:SDR family NAD(P)-dependent oxidoreductase [Agrococcus sp. SGAir0287]|uniref:SDR family NAD(P)-dependent oxidoreductase n=1 Tax=Agrococcus sp. SGAir0287 TaxID=2070347 RepID=UPI0010CCF2B5|nr:SDR family NAD(P)-dependent oxidoreductase [Agrococcus sp. SGAir0287]QCR19853.1 3-hydroxyacyl-CoA dehydrogenase [Agrococcus sp. SGAir0287]
MDIAGTSALVTGGASGLGAATAAMLRDAGAAVVVADMRAGDDERIHYVEADVTDEQQVQSAIDAASEAGPLRIVVQCAGIATAERAVGKEGPLPLERFSRVVAVNLVGTFNVARLAASRMQELEPVGEERGVLVHTASVAAFDGQIGQAAYSASKGGVAAMTLPLARELARTRIRVMTIAPGIFRTPMMAGLPEAAQASLAEQVPHPSRLGDPAEYAALVRHVVENPMLNGETIRLDGAIRMAPR